MENQCNFFEKKDDQKDALFFHKRKFILRFIGVACVLVVAICIFLYKNEMKISVIDTSNMKVLTTDNGVKLNIETISYEQRIRKERELTISGWCVIPGKETNLIENYVVLKDVENSKMYKLPTTIVTRSDVTTYINDGYNYDNSGFLVHLMIRDLKLEQKKYEICLLYKISGEKYIIQTGQYLN